MENLPRIVPASDRSLLVVFGDDTATDSHVQVLQLTRALGADPGICNLHPAFATVLVDFDPRVESAPAVARRIERLLQGLAGAAIPEPRTVTIPVCYERDCAPDLEEVAAIHGLAPDVVVGMHVEAAYRVDFIGFSPGFPYLSGLPAALATPRLDTPRTRVPAGSVAIGGSHAGVYPIESPGGWRLIGRTPMRLFAPEREPMSRLEMGDRVRFEPISRSDFDRLAP